MQVSVALRDVLCLNYKYESPFFTGRGMVAGGAGFCAWFPDGSNEPKRRRALAGQGQTCRRPSKLSASLSAWKAETQSRCGRSFGNCSANCRRDRRCPGSRPFRGRTGAIMCWRNFNLTTGRGPRCRAGCSCRKASLAKRQPFFTATGTAAFTIWARRNCSKPITCPIRDLPWPRAATLFWPLIPIALASATARV